MALFILLVKIVDDAMGYIAIADVVDPDTLMTVDGRKLKEQSAAQLSNLLRERTDERGKHYVSTDRLFNAFLKDVAQTQPQPPCCVT